MKTDLKICIVYQAKTGPWGGANQFLKTLQAEFERLGVYEENLQQADILIFNSHHNLELGFKLKKTPGQIFIHRIDGPLAINSSREKLINRILNPDEQILQFIDLFIDGVVFQSNWSMTQNKLRYSKCWPFEKVIHNAANNLIFNSKDRKSFNKEEKTRLIAIHWSADRMRGFEIYKFLDENLDFSRYEMTLVGNSPFNFANIKLISPVPSEVVAQLLKQHDIFITASRKDVCSNSLIEALSCGLPAVAINDGGHPELVRQAGLLFNSEEDIIDKIEHLRQDYHFYQSKIPDYSIANIAIEYYQFAKDIYQAIKDGAYRPKLLRRASSLSIYRLKFSLLQSKLLERVPFLYLSLSNKTYRTTNMSFRGRKIALGYQIRKGPWGGANQFLITFKDYFKAKGAAVVDHLEDGVDLIILINPRRGSGTFGFKEVYKYKKYNPKTKIICRINDTDLTGKDYRIDRLRLRSCEISDGVVFISDWLRDYYIAKGFDCSIPYAVIRNGADQNIFNPKGYLPWDGRGPLKIVTHHWSDNWKKGADVYQQFDQLLEDNRMREQFEFSYIGQLPRVPKKVHFRNIKCIPPLFGKSLADEIKKHHVYLTAARYEGCGMHQLEGAACGLPLLFIDEGGGAVECCEGFGIKFSIRTFVSSLFEMRQCYNQLQSKMNFFPLNSNLMNQEYEKFILSLLKG